MLRRLLAVLLPAPAFLLAAAAAARADCGAVPAQAQAACARAQQAVVVLRRDPNDAGAQSEYNAAMNAMSKTLASMLAPVSSGGGIGSDVQLGPGGGRGGLVPNPNVDSEALYELSDMLGALATQRLGLPAREDAPTGKTTESLPSRESDVSPGPAGPSPAQTKASDLSSQAGRLLSRGDYGGAATRAVEALALDPRDARARAVIAQIAAESRQARAEEKARAAAQTRFGPERGAEAGPTGGLGTRAGRTDVSEVGPRGGAPLLGAGPAVGVLPPETGVLVAQARALAAQGRWDEALLALHQAVDQDPKRPELWDLLSEAASQAGDHETAIAAAKKALELDANDARALRAKAYAELEKGDAAAALADAERAVALDPGNGLGYLYRAMAEERLGRKDKALADYAAAARLDPALAPLADAAIARLGGKAGASSRASRLTLFRTGVVGGTGLLILLGLLGTASGRRVAREYARRLRTVVAGPAEEPAGPVVVPEAATAALGARVGGHYRITGELGRGGMGAVFLALDEKLDRPVAIKQLHREGRGSAEDLARFLDEARLVASLKHPNVVEIYSVLADRDPMLVFEYVEGESLDKVLRRGAKLSPSRARRVVAEVCAALECAHARGIIHRDLKPGNVMIAKDGAARVMDFGIAHRSRGGGTFTRVDASGTPHYMAPEQESGSVSRASDLYALAVVAYEMLTGSRPFAGPSFLGQKLDKEFLAASRMNPTLPPGVDAFFDRALDPDPLKRPRTAPEFLKEFDAALAKAASST